MRVEFTPEAAQEYSQAVEFYSDRSLWAADRFKAEIHRLIVRLEEHPESAPEYAVHLRRAVLVRYPYAIFYSLDVQGDRVLVARILHNRRSPASWPR